jgi:hypothetical protein
VLLSDEETGQLPRPKAGAGVGIGEHTIYERFG